MNEEFELSDDALECAESDRKYKQKERQPEYTTKNKQRYGKTTIKRKGIEGL